MSRNLGSRAFWRASTAVAVTAVAMLSVAAHAQDTANTAQPEGDIVVTGTRVVRDGSQAPTPVTAVTSEALTQSAPSNIPDALNKLPQFTGSTSQSAGGTFNAGSAPLGNYLNLRALGSGRNLVLLNGQRVPPTINTNAVDSNVLPQALVKRVDVVTGGVSAVYGSDAVSGVVNYVLDTKFKGLKLTAQTGISNYGDSFSYRYGAAFGTDIGERIHLIASYEHYNNKGISSIFDRQWATNAPSQQGGGANANSAIKVFANTRRNNVTDGGVVLSGPLTAGCAAGVKFASNGTLSCFDPGAPVLGGTSGTTNLNPLTSIGGDGSSFGEPQFRPTSITGALKTDQAFARLEANLTDDITFHAQGVYAMSKTSFNSAPNSGQLNTGSRVPTIFADNPYLRPEVAALLPAGGSFTLGRIYNDIQPVTNRTQTEFWSAQAGLEGKLGGSWEWDANYVYGRADQTATFNEINSRNFFAAVDAVDKGQYLTGVKSGQIVCRVTLVNPTLLPDCQPINIMGAGNISNAAFSFIRRDSWVRYVNTMQYVNANLHGDLFQLPAGAVKLAVGAEYREQKLDQTSNSDPFTFNDPATGPAARAAYYSGIRGVPASSLLFYSINVGLASGKQTVKEVYGELGVPLLKDTVGFQDLSLDLATRLTDYKTSGSVVTWKAGVNWTPMDGVRVRFNRSRDIAAPNLNQLYAGASVVFAQTFDSKTNTSGAPQIVSSGNALLKPEKADTTTLGIVVQPKFAPGLTLSIDGYKITINGAIGTQAAQDMVNDCNNSNGTAPSCPFITRDSNGFISSILAGPLNLATLKTQGIDLELSYRFPLLGGNMTLRGFVNYLDKYDTQSAASQPVRVRVGRATDDGIGLPRWKGLLSQSWDNERFGVSLSERFTGKYVLGPPQQVWEVPFVMPNRVYVDTNITYNFDTAKRYQAFLNVQNLFNVTPPLLPTLIENLTPPTDKVAYDPVGRYFTVGIRAKF